MNIQEIIQNDNLEYTEIKKSWSKGILKTLVAFANTEGGIIVIGYDEINNCVIGVGKNVIQVVMQDLCEYNEVCKIETINIESKVLLVITVRKSNEIFYYDDKAWYRNGTMNVQYDLRMITDIYKTVFDSVKDLTISELAREVNVGEEIVREILTSGLGDIPIQKVRKSDANHYYIKEEVVDNGKLEKDFKKVKDSSELIKHLEYKAKKIAKDSMLHQYTTISAALAIIKKGEFYIGSPIRMNDISEYKNFILENKNNTWEDTFFTCFMDEDNENIAMWSQYAMPWDKGVRLSIPAEKVRQWIKGIEVLYIANVDTKEKIKERQVGNSKFRKSFYKVAYTNEDDIKFNGKKEIVKVGDATNEVLTNLYRDKELRGYVKNIAWSYEKEVRFRVEIPSNNEVDEISKIKGIIIDIPDDIMNYIEITKGPRVDEHDEDWIKLVKLLKEKKMKSTAMSLFEGKLQNMACDRCNRR